jgi:hypothetical protein
VAGIVAWGTVEVGLLYATILEGEFTRTLAHWGTLILLFVATAGGGPVIRTFNPFVMTSAAAGGALPAVPLVAYAVLGLLAAVMTGTRLRTIGAS